MTDKLTRPLYEDQIVVAGELYGMLSKWQLKNKILESLKDLDSNLSDPERTLLKVAAINQFYYTNLWAIDKMTEQILRLHITSKLYNRIPHDDLVEKIALLKVPEPEDPGQISSDNHEGEMPEDPAQHSKPVQKKKRKGSRMHTSFASKFAHFFISEKSFPIYDTFAIEMVNFHIHHTKRTKDDEHPYRAFCKNIKNLMEWAPLSCSYEELDRYLWLAGIYKAWVLNKDAKINQEVRALFKEQASEALLKRLFPYVRKGKQWILKD